VAEAKSSVRGSHRDFGLDRTALMVQQRCRNGEGLAPDLCVGESAHAWPGIAFIEPAGGIDRGSVVQACTVRYTAVFKECCA
jgi:hypothetical protein